MCEALYKLNKPKYHRCPVRKETINTKSRSNHLHTQSLKRKKIWIEELNHKINIQNKLNVLHKAFLKSKSKNDNFICPIHHFLILTLKLLLENSRNLINASKQVKIPLWPPIHKIMNEHPLKGHNEQLHVFKDTQKTKFLITQPLSHQTECRSDQPPASLPWVHCPSHQSSLHLACPF